MNVLKNPFTKVDGNLNEHAKNQAISKRVGFIYNTAVMFPRFHRVLQTIKFEFSNENEQTAKLFPVFHAVILISHNTKTGLICLNIGSRVDYARSLSVLLEIISTFSHGFLT